MHACARFAHAGEPWRDFELGAGGALQALLLPPQPLVVTCVRRGGAHSAPVVTPTLAQHEPRVRELCAPSCGSGRRSPPGREAGAPTAAQFDESVRRGPWYAMRRAARHNVWWFERAMARRAAMVDTLPPDVRDLIVSYVLHGFNVLEG